MSEQPVFPRGAPETAGGDREIDYRSVRRFTLFLLVLVLGGLVSGWALFRFFRSRIASDQAPAPPLAGARENPPPPEPRLEGPPGVALKALRTKEDAVLSTWGWVDRDRTTAMVPVDRAIEIAAEKGLPLRYGPAPAAAAPGGAK